ncbi:MAG: nucleotide sugar dehydrogenase [Candidatus Curtissbacteria bacterium]|nr:nucleotide sugar dehydrogenase [Candidatus Curtissbacteria bacterium]
MQTISVVGLGKLGSPFLATCASRGFNVIGLDVNRSVVDLINRTVPPVDEPGLPQLIKKNRARIRATTDYSEAINGSDITFIIVPTPSTKDGAFSNKYVLSAIQSIGKILTYKKKFHLIVVTSTIMPGSMDNEIVPLLEKISGKKVGYDIGLCYNPEFIALGSVIQNLLNPDFVMIGQSDDKSGEILENFYRKFCQNKSPVVRMNFINAEITKIALNSYITTKISFANTLAQICEKIPGGDVDQVTKALGLDSRIGNKYLKGALPYGGPCFPRDNRAFIHFAKKLKVSSPIAVATDKVNNDLAYKLAEKINSQVPPGGKVAILGLSYKKDTDVAEESAGVKIANLLSQKRNHIYAWDPKATNTAKPLLSSKVTLAKSMKDCLAQADVIVIASDWQEFKDIKPGDLASDNKRPILMDCWRVLDPLKYKNVAQYWAIGLESTKLESE